MIPSAVAPVAINCWDRPGPDTMDGLTGVTRSDTRGGGKTLRTVVPLTDPDEALIKVPPNARLVASPELDIVATPGTEELQVTEFVKSCGLPLVKTPVAVNCNVPPSWTDGLA